jgi:hypothetical protein
VPLPGRSKFRHPRAMTDPAAASSPLDEVFQEVQRSLRTGALNIERLLGPVEGALLAYRRALEAQLAKEYAATHMLRFQRPAGPTREVAAARLRELVLALPDFDPIPRAAPPPEPRAEGAVGTAPPTGVPADSVPAERTLADVLPRVVAGVAERTLVVLGALAGRKRALPAPLAAATEWIDTSQGGAHAAQTLPPRIRQGRVLGIVLCDQVISHQHAEPVLAAARAAGVPVGFAGKGGNAGIARALRSIEEQLPD